MMTEFTEFNSHASICTDAAKRCLSEKIRETGKRFWEKGEIIDAVLWFYPNFRVCFIPWKFLDRYKTKHGNYNLTPLVKVIENKYSF